MDLSEEINLGVAVGTATLATATGALAWFTKRSVDEAGRARETWSSIAIDSTRARMDQSSPSVDVRIQEISWPPMSGDTTPQGRYSIQYNQDHSWTIPRDKGETVGFCAVIAVENLSDSPVEIECEGDFFDLEADPLDSRPPYRLPPHSIRQLQFQEGFQIGSLTVSGDREEGKPVTTGMTGSVTMNELKENGVSDTWNITVAANIVQQDRLNSGLWNLVGRDSAKRTGFVSPRVREYYVSRADQVKLPITNLDLYDSPLAQHPIRTRLRAASKRVGELIREQL